MNYKLLLLPRGNFSKPEDRKKLVDMLSLLIEGRKDTTFEPYCPNEKDDYYWTLDAGNNWKVKFFADKPDCIEINYRYGHDHVVAFTNWLKVRLGFVDPVIAESLTGPRIGIVTA